jgi:hypothetical protein
MSLQVVSDSKISHRELPVDNCATHAQLLPGIPNLLLLIKHPSEYYFDVVLCILITIMYTIQIARLWQFLQTMRYFQFLLKPRGREQCAVITVYICVLSFIPFHNFKSVQRFFHSLWKERVGFTCF